MAFLSVFSLFQNLIFQLAQPYLLANIKEINDKTNV